MIKKFHFILKSGTLNDEEKEWFNVGEYKKLVNLIGSVTETCHPSKVSENMKELLKWYKEINEKTLNDIIEFHYRVEKIHPFQDGNGRIGRIIMCRECLVNNIMPFFIEDRNKDYYIRGLKEYTNDKAYLIDTCLNSQDNYENIVNYFLGELK